MPSLNQEEEYVEKQGQRTFKSTFEIQHSLWTSWIHQGFIGGEKTPVFVAETHRFRPTEKNGSGGPVLFLRDEDP